VNFAFGQPPTDCAATFEVWEGICISCHRIRLSYVVRSHGRQMPQNKGWGPEKAMTFH
jgi:hypothetical protein